MFDDKFVEAIRAAFPGFKDELSRTTTAAEVPGWDSFGHVQLVFELEDAYGIEIDANASLRCADVGSLYDMIKDRSGA
jgi:acyl carrier protein